MGRMFVDFTGTCILLSESITEPSWHIARLVPLPMQPRLSPYTTLERPSLIRVSVCRHAQLSWHNKRHLKIFCGVSVEVQQFLDAASRTGLTSGSVSNPGLDIIVRTFVIIQPPFVICTCVLLARTRHIMFVIMAQALHMPLVISQAPSVICVSVAKAINVTMPICTVPTRTLATSICIGDSIANVRKLIVQKSRGQHCKSTLVNIASVNSPPLQN